MNFKSGIAFLAGVVVLGIVVYIYIQNQQQSTQQPTQSKTAQLQTSSNAELTKATLADFGRQYGVDLAEVESGYEEEINAGFLTLTLKSLKTNAARVQSLQANCFMIHEEIWKSDLGLTSLEITVRELGNGKSEKLGTCFLNQETVQGFDWEQPYEDAWNEKKYARQSIAEKLKEWAV